MISKPVGVSSNFQVIFPLSVSGAVFLYIFSVSQNFWVKLGLGSLTDEVRGTGAAPSSTPLPDVNGFEGFALAKQLYFPYIEFEIVITNGKKVFSDL